MKIHISLSGAKKIYNFSFNSLIMYSDSHSAFNLLRVEVSVNEDHQVPDHCEHGPRHKEGGSETRDRRNKCCHMYKGATRTVSSE